tara:strand:+ start:915 stop:1484 length:570 start_codon:yes stop_codon:yes gene_type:complete
MGFTIEHYTHSDTAIKKGISNMPGVDKDSDETLTSEYIIGNLTALHNNCIGPIMKHFNRISGTFVWNIAVSSGYRCKELNSAVGGVENSQHIHGMAIDIVYTTGPAADVFNWAISNLSGWSQIIWEFPEKGQWTSGGGGSEWIHISYNESKNNKVLSLASNKEDLHTAHSGERIGKYTHGITTADQLLV